MNRLRLAIQGFESFSQRLTAQPNEAVSDEAEAWLKNEVCPVVEELSSTGKFQRITRWSLDYWCSEGANPGRAHLPRFDDAFVGYANALKDGIAVIDSASSATSSPSPVSDEHRTQLDLFADRPWILLANPSDFLHPFNDLYQKASSEAFTLDFRSQERRLPLGDYICRYLMARVEFWQTQVLQLREPVDSLLADGEEAIQALSRIMLAQIKLKKTVEAIRLACNSEDLRQREACAALVQVYAAYDPNPQLQWLGVSSDRMRTSIPQVRMCIRRPSDVTIVRQLSGGGLQPIRTETQLLCDPTVLRQIAGALQDLEGFYEVPDDPDDQIRWRAEQTRLVLVDRAPRQVFWDGKLVGENSWDNHTNSWYLLWELASRPGMTIDRGDLGGENARKRRSRLANILLEHQGLDQQIETIRGQGYRLNLPANEVTLLQSDGLGGLQSVNVLRAPRL